jgi:hypothetical protein
VLKNKRFLFRQEQFDKSAFGRAARAQTEATKKQQNQTSGEPVLKVCIVYFVLIYEVNLEQITQICLFHFDNLHIFYHI